MSTNSQVLQLFLQDISDLPKEKLEKIRAYTVVHMQLTRFTQAELKEVIKFCTKKIKEAR